MNAEQQHLILTISLYAAFADGIKDDREREEIRRIAVDSSDNALRAVACAAGQAVRLHTSGIVIGSSGLNVGESLLFGAVADKVMRRSSLPAMVAP